MNNIKRLVLATLLALQTGCAPQEWSLQDDGAFDPIEPINRKVYTFNSDVDALLGKPLALVYSSLGEDVRAPLANFYGNLGEPKNVVNHVLQQNGKDAVNALARFLYNSSVGVGGLFDVAKDIDLEEREADFGQTLRAYGMNHTAYIVLPIFGPSSVADVPGQAADTVSFPPYYLKDTAAKASIGAVNGVRRRSELLDFTAIAEETALDEYSFVRDTYEEIRANEAKKRGQEFIFRVAAGRNEYRDNKGAWIVVYDANAANADNAVFVARR
ncbi:MAG: VacJ family lipoprotein [Candidatus Zeuxoniibacter abyssi]|nr:MAG: VacJ family lipoprotein [Candidatus Persebacteraceae bacterium AB1(2)]